MGISETYSCTKGTNHDVCHLSKGSTFVLSLHLLGTSSIVESREEYNFNDAKSLEDERPRMAEMEGIPIEKLAIFFSKPRIVKCSSV